MKIGIGSGLSYKAIVLASFIKKSYKDVKVYAFVNLKHETCFYSKYFDGIIADYCIDDIVNFRNKLKKHRIDLFIPVDSMEYNVIYSKNEYLELKQLYYLGDKDAYEVLNNKSKLHDLACKLNIKVPVSFYNDVSKIEPGNVVKPVSLTSSKGVMYVNKMSDVEYVKSKISLYGDFIVQEYIKGEGVGYSAFVQNGEIIAGYGHKRVAEYPISGGSSVLRESFENNELKIIATTILSHTKWSGFVMIEFKLTDSGQLYLIEVNPRIWGSINQGLQNGVNYLKTLIANEKQNHANYHKSVTYLSPLIYKSFLGYICKLKFEPLIRFFKHYRYLKADSSILDDPFGFAGMVFKNQLIKK